MKRAATQLWYFWGECAAHRPGSVTPRDARLRGGPRDRLWLLEVGREESVQSMESGLL